MRSYVIRVVLNQCHWINKSLPNISCFLNIWYHSWVLMATNRSTTVKITQPSLLSSKEKVMTTRVLKWKPCLNHRNFGSLWSMACQSLMMKLSWRKIEDETPKHYSLFSRRCMSPSSRIVAANMSKEAWMTLKT